MDFINRLREKPTATKKQIAFGTSAVVTLMIFGIWASVLRFGVGQKSSENTAAVANGSNTDVNPFDAFWNVFSTGWDGLSNSINQTKTEAGNIKNFVNGTVATTSTNDVFILAATSTGETQITQ